jgi:gamma-glutamyl:cysteine ligase YbdK (ATP-grasp superfamily)
MSDTPETDDLARGNHVVPTEWAEQLEKERDDVMAQRNSFQALSQSLAETCTKLKTERDEAREQIDKLLNKLEQLYRDVEIDKLKTARIYCQNSDYHREMREKAERERDEALELAEQMSESNQVLLADVRFYRDAWEKLKKEKQYPPKKTNTNRL